MSSRNLILGKSYRLHGRPISRVVNRRLPQNKVILCKDPFVELQEPPNELSESDIATKGKPILFRRSHASRIAHS